MNSPGTVYAQEQNQQMQYNGGGENYGEAVNIGEVEVQTRKNKKKKKDKKEKKEKHHGHEQHHDGQQQHHHHHHDHHKADMLQQKPSPVSITSLKKEAEQGIEIDFSSSLCFHKL